MFIEDRRWLTLTTRVDFKKKAVDCSGNVSSVKVFSLFEREGARNRNQENSKNILFLILAVRLSHTSMKMNAVF